jgi:RNA polymerase sigma factor (sigma-70 family)
MAVDSDLDDTANARPLLDDPFDHPAFEALWIRYSGRATQLAGLLCGHREMAEDAVAEAFARVLPRWRSRSIEEFWPYLRVAVVNQLRGGARRDLTARRWQRRQPVPAVSPSSEHRIAERAALAAALDQLAPMQRKALVLRYFEDLPEADAASLLGCSVGTIKSSASRGLARLRELLGEGDDDA